MATIAISGVDEDEKKKRFIATTAPPGRADPPPPAAPAAAPAGSSSAPPDRGAVLPQAGERDPRDTLRDDMDRRLGQAPSRELGNKGATYPTGEFAGMNRSQAVTKVMEDNGAFGGQTRLTGRGAGQGLTSGREQWNLDKIPPRSTRPAGDPMSALTRQTSIGEFRNSPGVAAANWRQQQSDKLNSAGATWRKYQSVPPPATPPVVGAKPVVGAGPGPVGIGPITPGATAGEMPSTPARASGSGGNALGPITRAPATTAVPGGAPAPAAPVAATPPRRMATPPLRTHSPAFDAAVNVTRAAGANIRQGIAKGASAAAGVAGPALAGVQAAGRQVRQGIVEGASSAAGVAGTALAGAKAAGQQVRKGIAKGASAVAGVAAHPVARAIRHPIREGLKTSRRIGRSLGRTARDFLYEAGK